MLNVELFLEPVDLSSHEIWIIVIDRDAGTPYLDMVLDLGTFVFIIMELYWQHQRFCFNPSWKEIHGNDYAGSLTYWSWLGSDLVDAWLCEKLDDWPWGKIYWWARRS